MFANLHSDVFEGRLGESANDSVGDVTDTGLQRKQVFRETTHLDFVCQEFDQVTCDGFGCGISRSVGAGVVRAIAFDNGNNFILVDRNGSLNKETHPVKTPLIPFRGQNVKNDREKFLSRLTVPILSSVFMIRYGLRLGGLVPMVMSWRPSKDGMRVLTSIMILSAI